MLESLVIHNSSVTAVQMEYISDNNYPLNHLY